MKYALGLSGGFVLMGIAVALAGAPSSGFDKPGNVLITDQFNNRVIEVDSHGKIVWHFGLGPADFSPASIIGCNDAQRVGSLTLMAGTGTPAVNRKLRTAPIRTGVRTTGSSWSIGAGRSSGSTDSSGSRVPAPIS